MKKYNLSKIMKRAWEFVKKVAMTMSTALKQAWAEAKNPTTTIKMCVVGKETFTVNTLTGKVTGKTYHSRKFLKDNFDATWNNDTAEWTVDTNKFNTELSNYPDYYKKYIVADDTASQSNNHTKCVSYEKLVNRNDGFYNYTEYTDGTKEYVFVG